MKKKLLIIGHVWPEPSTTAAGHRMQQLINAFKDFGYKLYFGCTAQKTEYSLNLRHFEVESVLLQLNHPSFDTLIKELNPGVVVFDRFMVEEQFGWRVAEFAPKAVRILNTEDLHSLRKSRAECHTKGEEFTLPKWYNHPMTLREVASIYRSDISLMVSTFEIEILQKELGIPQELLLHLPFMLDKISKEKQREWRHFKDRQDFISFGNGKHAPNVDSIHYLKSTIWPLIREKLPEVQLKIYGAYLPKSILQMHNPKEGFHVLGWVENLQLELQKAKICLAPLLFGAGIKGKLVDAMLNGTPSATTSIGAEGMHGELPWSGGIGDYAKTLVETAISLYSDESKWNLAQQNGVEIINKYYCKNVLRHHLKSCLETLQNNLEAQRARNFMGRLLQHQTLNTTKYMARWIEAKNGN